MLFLLLPLLSLSLFLACRFSFPFGWLPDRYMVEVRKFADWSICIRKILYPYMFFAFWSSMWTRKLFSFFSSSWEVSRNNTNRWYKKKEKLNVKKQKFFLNVSTGMFLPFLLLYISIRYCTRKGQLGWLSLISCAHARMSTARLLYKETKSSIISRPSIKAGIEMICLHRSTQVAQRAKTSQSKSPPPFVFRWLANESTEKQKKNDSLLSFRFEIELNSIVCRTNPKWISEISFFVSFFDAAKIS